MGRARPIAIVVVAVLVVSACGRFARRSETTAAPEETASVGEAFRTFAPPRATRRPPPTASAGARSAIVVRLTDQNNGHPAAIPVRYARAGGQTTVATDGRGEVRIPGPGGFRIDVLQGCHETVSVTGGGFANVNAPVDGTKPVDLPVRWEHRIAPGPPVQPNRSGHWPVGEELSLRFSVIDRCAKDRAPGALYPTFEFETDDVLDLVGTPTLKADGDGRGSITVRCVREGDPSVIAVDARNPSDSFDMVQESVGFVRPRCE